MTEPKLANSRRNYTYAALCAASGRNGSRSASTCFRSPAVLQICTVLFGCWPARAWHFLAGIAIAFQTLGQANADSDLPAAAPRWMRALQYLIGLAIFCCFSAIATWIAFGPGERQFSERSSSSIRQRMPRSGGSLSALARSSSVMHSCRCSGWLATISCQVKASRVPVDPVPAAEQALVRFSDDAETRVLAV